MNTRQRIVIAVGAALVAFTGLVVPWTFTQHFKMMGVDVDSEKPAGYDFIYSPPLPLKPNEGGGIKVDIPRLLIEWFVIAVATVTTFHIFRIHNHNEPK